MRDRARISAQSKAHQIAPVPISWRFHEVFPIGMFRTQKHVNLEQETNLTKND